MNTTRPAYPEGYRPATTGHYSIINVRAATGFTKWGFVVYRGTYENDDCWNTFISLLKASAAFSLRLENQGEELGPDLAWTVVEDRASLDGASKDAVRTRFRDWVAARSVERDGEQADVPWLVKSVARFRYCIYVDEASLSSITASRVGSTRQWYIDGGQVVLIDGTHGHHDAENGEEHDEEDDEERDDEDEYSPVEGNTAYDVGWAYVDACDLVSMYANLSHGGCDSDKWEGVYRGRRPERGPQAGQGKPLLVVGRQA